MDTLYFILFVLACAVIGYLVGSIPSARIIASGHGIDITKYGSHNAGGTNVGRVLGWGPAVLTMFMDAMKVYIPCMVAMAIMSFTPIPLGSYKNIKELICGLIALSASLGHSFPIYCRFKGGKCVSCFAGYVLFVSPIMCLVGLIVFFSVLKLSHKVSMGSLIGAPSMFVLSVSSMVLDLTITPLVTDWNGGMYYTPSFMLHLSYITTIFLLLIASLIVIRHRANIRRLKHGEEPNTVFENTLEQMEEKKK